MKKVIMPIAAILAALAIFFGWFFAAAGPNDTGVFSLKDFSAELENDHFRMERNCGAVGDYRAAAKAGKAAVAERFGVSDGLLMWMGWDVQHDADEGAYYVRAYPVYPFLQGGGYGVILRWDGTVLAIWGDK